MQHKSTKIMSIIKLFTFMLIIPALSFAQDGISSLPVLSKIVNTLNHAWHYKLVTLDNQQSITLANILIAVISLILGLKIARHLSSNFKKRLFKLIDLDANSASLIGRVIDYLFMIIVMVFVLDIAGVPLNIFTFIGGAFVISIGLSSQHLLNNFISGIALIIESKIKVGDIIEFENIIGKVESIEARMVQIKTQTNMHIFIPHSKLMQERFTNWTYNGERVRLSTEFKIDSKDKIDNFSKIVVNAVSQNRNILTTPKPQLLLFGFDNNLLHYEVNFWINLNDVDRRFIISEVNNQIFNTLSSYNIPLAVSTINYIRPIEDKITNATD